MQLPHRRSQLRVLLKPSRAHSGRLLRRPFRLACNRSAASHSDSAPRFFVALLIGLLWVVPAWWSPRLIAGLFLVGRARHPRLRPSISCSFPSRARSKRSAAGSTRRRSPRVQTSSSASKTWHGPAFVAHSPTRRRPHSATLRRRSRLTAPRSPAKNPPTQFSPRVRGDVKIGRLFVRYRTWFGFAERWTAAPIAQTVRVLPDLEQARQQALY